MKVSINHETIASAIKTVVLEVASMKTHKYFVGDENKFSATVEAFAYTICTLIANSQKMAITVDGDIFSVNEYMVTQSIQALANASKVYVASGTEYVSEPWFEAVFTPVFQDGKKITAWNPMKFNSFMTAMADNLNKDVENFVGARTNMTKTKGVSVNDLKAMVTPEGNLVKLDGTTVDDHVSQVLAIPSIYPNECVQVYECYNERGIGKWLLA